MGNNDYIFTNYDPKIVGDRIAKERNALGMSQDKFIEAYGKKFGITTRRTLSKVENGDESCKFTVWQLLEFCRIFRCDMGYLLGEYDCHSRKATDICKETGLSENAVKNLTRLKPAQKEDCTSYIDEKGVLVIKRPDNIVPPARLTDTGEMTDFPVPLNEFFSQFIEHEYFTMFIQSLASAVMFKSYANENGDIWKETRDGYKTSDDDRLYSVTSTINMNEAISKFVDDAAHTMRERRKKVGDT